MPSYDDYLARFSQMTPDEVRAYLARAEEEKRRRAQVAAQARNVDQAKQKAAAVQRGAQNVAGVAVSEATSTVNPEAVLFDKRLANIPPERRERFQQSIEHGAGLTRELTQDLPRNIEGAKGKEIVAGDQRMIVDPKTGMSIATREEFPSVADHRRQLMAKDATGGESASVVGFLANVLEAPVRGFATVGTYAQDLQDSKSPPLSKLPGDVWAAMRGADEPEHPTVARGGYVAKRGAGIGDLFRKQARDVLAKNKDATVRDVLTGPLAGIYDAVTAVGSKIGSLQGVDETFTKESMSKWDLDQRLADVGPDHPLWDIVGHGTSIAVDPLNFLPIEKPVVAGAGLAAKVLEKAGAGGVVDAARAINQFHLPGSKSWVESKLARDLAKTEGKEGADVIASKMLSGEEQARAEQQMRNVDVVEAAKKVGAQMERGDNEAVRALIDGTNGSIAPIAPKTVEEQLEVISKAVAGGLGDALPTSERELLQAGGDAIVGRRYQLAKRLGVSDQMFKPHPWDTAPDDAMRRQALAAKRILGEWRFPEYELSSRLQLIKSPKAEPPQTLPRPPRAPAALAVEKVLGKKAGQIFERAFDPVLSRPDYDPFKRRTMEATEDIDTLRRHARVLAGELPPGTERTFLEDFARNTAAQADPIIREQARTLLRAKGRDLPPTSAGPAVRVADDSPGLSPAFNVAGDRVAHGVDDANAMLQGRGAPVEQFATGDVLREMSIASAEAGRRQSTARIAEVADSLTDEAGRRVVQSLDDALLAPRRGTVDPKLVVSRFTVKESAQRFIKDALTDGKLDGDEAQWLAGLALALKLNKDDLALRVLKKKPELAAKLRDFGLLKQREGQFMIGGKAFPEDVRRTLEAQGLKYIDAGERIAKLMPQLEGKVIPKALVPELERVGARMDIGVFEKVAFALNKFHAVWAPIVLNTPGFHVRNAFYGMFQIFLGVEGKTVPQAIRAMLDREAWAAAGMVASAAEAGARSDAVISIGGKNLRVADLAEEVRSKGVFESGRVADLERAVRDNARYADEGEALRRISPWSDRGLVTKEQISKTVVGRGLGSLFGGTITKRGVQSATMENVQRTFLYLHHRLRNELPPEKAAEKVMQHLFDYTGTYLSKPGKLARSVFPFWVWMTNSARQMADGLLANPQRYAFANHLYQTLGAVGQGDANRDPRFEPGYVGEGGFLPASGRGSPETQSFFALERPTSQAQWLEPMLQGDLGRAVSEVATNLSPAAAAVSERVTGNYQLGDRPVSPFRSELTENRLEAAFGMRQEDIIPYLLAKLGLPGLMAQLGLATLAPEVAQKTGRRSAADEQLYLQNRMISSLFGPRPAVTRPASVQTKKQVELNDAIEAERKAALERARRRTNPYATGEVFP
jgi:hypothetical protein